jgi:CRP-like cAMP-binding protein
MATPELGPAERERLFQRFGRSYASGEAIYGEGEPAEHCFLLHRGRVRVVKRVRGVERSLAVFKPGDVFGEDALLERTRRTASALALTEVEVLALDRAMFGILIAGNPEVAGRILEQLVRRLRYADEQLENAMLPDPPSRVINTLIRSATELESGPEGIVVPISPLELACRVGLDVDTVRKVTQQLRDTGYLRIVEERIVLPDLDALRQLHELLGRKENVRRGLP